MNSTKSQSRSRAAWRLAALVGALSFSPLLWNLTAFRTLFYFQDEWDLIDTWDRVGTQDWIVTVFAENFVPLFKALWGGAIVAGNGSYFVLVVLVWATHAFNTFLLVRMCAAIGGSRMSAALAGVVFGLAWINYETLAWTVQWSAALSLSFLLLGVVLVAHWEETGDQNYWKMGLLLSGCVAASSLCFSRGVLTGGALAVWALFRPAWRQPWRARAFVAVLAIAPAAAVAWWIFKHSSGNHQRLASIGREVVDFGLYYYAQAPLRTLWSTETPSRTAIIALALAKSGVFLAGLLLAPRRWRAVLLALWAFELGNAALLAVGRFHTGLAAAGSSRYQYGALAVWLPSVAVCFGRIVAWLPSTLRLRTAVATGLIIWTAVWVTRPWTTTMANWVPDRGGTQRTLLFHRPPEQWPPNLVLHSIPNDRASHLVKKFNLH